MFQNKHIIRASFIGLFLSILGSILFYRYFTVKNIVLETVIKENNKIHSYFIDEICNNNMGVQILTTKQSIKDSLNSLEFRDFVEKTIDFISSQNKIKISIFSINDEEIITSSEIKLSRSNSKSNAIFAYIENYFLKETSKEEIKSNLASGNKVHNIILRNLTPEMPEKIAFIESYYPISPPEKLGLETYGSLKIVTDISEEWEKIQFFEKRVTIFLIAGFAIFFAIVIFNTNHAQKIIDQQVASNKFLEEAKVKAEYESSAKTQFLANVSHELRTPLNAIIGFSEVILTEAYGKLQPEQYREYINDINNSGKHLLGIINDILDFSKASADKLKIDLIEVDATKLVSSSLRFVKPRADEAKVILIEKLPKDHVVIKADPKRLKQALLNLLSNAVKFTPENGSVTLELEHNIIDKKVYMRVIDTGIGMEEKDIPKALSSFGQIDNKLSRKYEGTGLGLPLTKKLVELMAGTFEIKSKPGVGTSVTLSFKQEEF